MSKSAMRVGISIIWLLTLVAIVSMGCNTGLRAQPAAPAGRGAPFTGIVKSGAELGEAKSYCPEGLYLVAGEGVLAGEAKMLLLRTPDGSGQAVMVADPTLAGQRVVVTGKYPAQDAFCEALICECEEYILVEQIEAQD